MTFTALFWLADKLPTLMSVTILCVALYFAFIKRTMLIGGVLSTLKKLSPRRRGVSKAVLAPSGAEVRRDGTRHAPARRRLPPAAAVARPTRSLTSHIPLGGHTEGPSPAPPSTPPLLPGGAAT